MKFVFVNIGEAKWGTDEEVFVVLLAHQSLGQLRLIFKEYEKISEKTLEQAIESEFSGKLKIAVLTIGAVNIIIRLKVIKCNLIILLIFFTV